jgi:hypothetical protein
LFCSPDNFNLKLLRRKFFPKIYASTNKKLLNKLNSFVTNIDTCTKTENYGLATLRVILELKFASGAVKKIYSFSGGDFYFDKVAFRRQEYFIRLIEKYFDKINWPNSKIEN